MQIENSLLNQEFFYANFIPIVVHIAIFVFQYQNTWTLLHISNIECSSCLSTIIMSVNNL